LHSILARLNVADLLHDLDLKFVELRNEKELEVVHLPTPVFATLDSLAFFQSPFRLNDVEEAVLINLVDLSLDHAGHVSQDLEFVVKGVDGAFVDHSFEGVRH